MAHVLASGISPKTIIASGIQAFDGPRLANLPPFCSHSTDSYVIPYFDLKGQRLRDFHRIRLLPEARKPGDGSALKYFQPPNTDAHLYLPPIITPERWNQHDSNGHLEDIFITEGEKKALKGAQEGLLCIGLGGVYNWRQKTVTTKVSKDAFTKGHESKDGKTVTVRQRANQSREEDDEDEDTKTTITPSPEMRQIIWGGRRVFITFDTDPSLNGNVQTAAFELALWLFDHDADPYQIVLPRQLGSSSKVGLDDFLRDEGVSIFRRLIPVAQFPAHPETKRWVRKTLNARKDRTGNVRVGRGIVAGLDAKGHRYVDVNRHYYFFDNGSKKLHDFDLSANDIRSLRLTAFGDVIMDDYGLLSTDGPAVSAVADFYTKVGPPSLIEPHRAVFAFQDPKTLQDVLYCQLSDSRIAKVTADSITFIDNGADNVLFQAGYVAGSDEDKIQDALAEHSRPRNLWMGSLDDFNIQALPNLTARETHLFLTALFHVNPWLKKWRGLLLPFELAVAEPNSGKTFLYNLRRGILTGNPSLDNIPTDIRSWYAQVKASAGMWICDNMGDAKRELREELSDELARLITEPDPHTTTRKLFTTDEALRIQMDCSFAATAIRNPFWKPDILQRMMIFHMAAIPAGQRDSNWYLQRLQNREEWIAEHLVSIQRFFQVVRRAWKPHYLSGHRLTHFEQTIGLMIVALGFPNEAQAIVPKLQEMVQRTIAENDPTMEALRTFAIENIDSFPNRPLVQLGDIVEWVDGDGEGRFTHLKTLKTSVALSRYFNSHTYDIERSAYLRREDVGNNKYVRILAQAQQQPGTIERSV